MRPSILNTINVPDIASKVPATIVRAALSVMRVVIRNIGGNTIFVAHSENELAQVALVSGVFSIPSGGEDVFVLAPKQGIWVVGQGAGGRACYAASEALFPAIMES